MDYIIINGKTLPADQAAVSVQDRGFRYGDGVFETIAVHYGLPYRLEWHLGRLQRGLEAIRITCPMDRVTEECRRLLHANRVTEGLLRIQITRGAGGRGYLPEAIQDATCVIETAPLPEIPKQPVALWLSSYQKISAAALPTQYKLCQGLNSTLARMEAANHDCFDALMLNCEGDVCETSSANVFWIKDDVLYTPPLAAGAVEGAMRAAIMELSPYPVRELRTNVAMLAEAEAVFLTNVAWKALPVAGLLPAGITWNSAAAAEIINTSLWEDIGTVRKLAMP